VCVNNSVDDRCGRSYRSQHGGHELVRLLGLHEAAHLEHANGQAGYHGRVLGQRLLQHLAVLFVVFKRLDLGHATEALKGAQVRLVYVGEMRVGYHDVGQRLDVAQTVCKSAGLSKVVESLHVLGTLSGAPADSSWPSRLVATRSASSQRRSAGAS
jgi:hypothetical protein